MLTCFVKSMANLVRASDVLGRIGGEEFAILMPETTIEQAYIFAERLRLEIAEMAIELDGVECHITISIGLVQAEDASTDLKLLLSRADSNFTRPSKRVETGPVTNKPGFFI